MYNIKDESNFKFEKHSNGRIRKNIDDPGLYLGEVGNVECGNVPADWMNIPIDNGKRCKSIGERTIRDDYYNQFAYETEMCKNGYPNGLVLNMDGREKNAIIANLDRLYKMKTLMKNKAPFVNQKRQSKSKLQNNLMIPGNQVYVGNKQEYLPFSKNESCRKGFQNFNAEDEMSFPFSYVYSQPDLLSDYLPQDYSLIAQKNENNLQSLEYDMLMRENENKESINDIYKKEYKNRKNAYNNIQVYDNNYNNENMKRNSCIKRKEHEKNIRSISKHDMGIKNANGNNKRLEKDAQAFLFFIKDIRMRQKVNSVCEKLPFEIVSGYKTNNMIDRWPEYLNGGVSCNFNDLFICMQCDSKYTYKRCLLNHIKKRHRNKNKMTC